MVITTLKENKVIFMKRTKYDAPAPIVKPISVDVKAIWDRKKTVSEDLTSRIMRVMQNAKRENDGQN